jgi:enoyl-[acyl-carrier protein] reductase I
MWLKDKKLLITGVVSKQSIAFHVAKLAQEQGAEIMLTGGPGRSSRLTDKAAQLLDPVPYVIPMDVTDKEQIKDVRDDIIHRWGKFDGFLHSIAYAPQSCIGGNFADSPWEDVSKALQVSSYSLAALGSAFAPLMPGGSIVALDFDATKVWENYNWMGVCKAGLESVSRYLAKDLGIRYGIRVNCIASGPLRTIAAKAIPAFKSFEDMWMDRSILEWSVSDDAPEVAGTAIFLFSNLSRKITGEMIHVDGGFHIMGSPVIRPESTEGEN